MKRFPTCVCLNTQGSHFLLYTMELAQSFGKEQTNVITSGTPRWSGRTAPIMRMWELGLIWGVGVCVGVTLGELPLWCDMLLPLCNIMFGDVLDRPPGELHGEMRCWYPFGVGEWLMWSDIPPSYRETHMMRLVFNQHQHSTLCTPSFVNIGFLIVHVIYEWFFSLCWPCCLYYSDKLTITMEQ